MNNQGEETSNFTIDLIQIQKDDQIPAKDDTNHTCPHPIFMSNICTNCGEENNNGIIPTIPFDYISPNLTLSLQEINRIRDKNLRTLLTRKKLHLVIDLDHTLLHQRALYKLTPEDKKFLKAQKHGGDHNFIEGGSLFEVSFGWVKLRPFVRNFLDEASTMFDMTVYTLSNRSVTRTLASLLDPNGIYWRVISKDDCEMLDKNKKCLDNVLEHERVVVVLDDTELVWEDFKGNYVRVIPYNFFSYHSSEDKERDASPPKQSWSQLNGDESEQNGVLANVLEKLRAIYSGFYDDDSMDFENKDVREVVQRVQMREKSGKKKHQKKKSNGKAVRR